MDQTTATSNKPNGRPPHFNAMPVQIRGKVYSSHREAAKALGVSPSAISMRLREKGHAETVGLGLAGGAPGNTNRAKEITLWDITFPSRTIAAEKLGITRSQISKWISPKASEWQKRQLLLFTLRYKRKREKEERESRRALAPTHKHRLD